MKAIRLFAVVMMLAMTLVHAGLVQAQDSNPGCLPLGPDAVQEIIAKWGANIGDYCPGYSVLGVMVAKAPPSNRAMVEEIAVTRGLAAEKYVKQNAFVIIPVTSSVHGIPPTQAELNEIIATRGASLMVTQGK